MPKNGKKIIGVLAASGWVDPTIDEFRKIHGDEFFLTQTIQSPPGFDYGFASMRDAEPDLTQGARMLSEAGADLIIQVGPYFAYMIGKDKAGIRALEDRLSQAAGVPVITNGGAVIAQLDQIGAKRINVACPYYDERWRTEYKRILTHLNYDVVGMSDFVSQGIFKMQADVDALSWNFDLEDTLKSVRLAARRFDGYDALVVSGAGIRTLDWLADMERELNIPIVSADGALYKEAIARIRQ